MYQTGVPQFTDSRLVSLRRRAEALRFQRDATLRALWVAMDMLAVHHPRQLVDAGEMLEAMAGGSAEVDPFPDW